MTTTLSPPPLRWDGERLHVLDQTRLPAHEEVLVLAGAEDTARAIERLAVRGAPLIGVAAAYGLAMEVTREPTLGALERGGERLATCRPTARNLAWAVERVRAAALAAGPSRVAAAARAEAEAIQREDEAASLALGEHGAALLDGALPAGPVTVLTHCNSGCLAASGRGTGLGVIAALADRRPVQVLACEARPLLQGARLTVWELGRLGIGHALVVDSAAAGLIRTGQVHAVVTGLDRVAANGDVANKVGTYGLALAAHAAGIPFVAAGPLVVRRPPARPRRRHRDRGARRGRGAHRRRRAADRAGHAGAQSRVRRHARGARVGARDRARGRRSRSTRRRVAAVT